MEIQWPLAIFSLLAGCGGGVLASLGIADLMGAVRKARVPSAVVALILLVIGGCASVAHLAQPSNIMAAATNIFSFSGISVELIMLGLSAIMAIVVIVLVRKNPDEPLSKVVAILAIVVGVVMAFAVGNGYVMESQPLWNTPVLPCAYMGSGLAMGACLLAAIAGASGDKTGAKPLALLAFGFTALQTVAFLAFSATAQASLDAALYWGGAMVVGCVGTLVLAWFSQKNVALAWGAVATAAIGGLCFRATMWLLGSGFINAFAVAAEHGVLGL